MWSLRFHEIAESRHRILDPFTEAKLDLLGQVCELQPGQRILDLCCGKAELLCRWSAAHGVSGVGVDISRDFLEAAQSRAAGLAQPGAVELVHADAAEYAAEVRERFDVVSCLGATWIGNGLVGTLALMRPHLRPGGLLLVGEPYLIDPLRDGEASGAGLDAFETLRGTLARFDEAELDLVEMVMADHDSWDRYEAAQWRSVDLWLRANPEDPDGDALRMWIRRKQENYLSYERRHLGWGAFVLRPR